MKQFVDAEIKVTRFEYENLMDVGITSGPTVPGVGEGGPDESEGEWE